MAHDPVNHPDHYTAGGIETIDYLRAKLSGEGFEAYCVGNALKYLSRYKLKGGVEDVQKAIWYLKEGFDIVDDDGGVDGVQDGESVHYGSDAPEEPTPFRIQKDENGDLAVKVCPNHVKSNRPQSPSEALKALAEAAADHETAREYYQKVMREAEKASQP